MSVFVRRGRVGRIAVLAGGWNKRRGAVDSSLNCGAQPQFLEFLKSRRVLSDMPEISFWKLSSTSDLEGLVGVASGSRGSDRG